VPPELAALEQTPPPTTDDELAALWAKVLPHQLHRVEYAELERHLDGTIISLEASQRSAEILADWRTVDRLHGIRCPTLVLAGRHDVVTPPQHAEQLASLVPAAELVVFEESGHWPWIEEPDAFFAAVRRWLVG
jgi:proline iminopeptidase